MAHTGGLDGQTLRAPSEIKLEIDEVLGTGFGRLGANPEEARADSPLQRAQLLPLQAVRGKSRAMALADRLRVEALAPVLLVTVSARKIHLAVSLLVKNAPALERGVCRTVGVHGN